jgi:ribokinase
VLAHTDERSMLCDHGANLLLSPSDVDLALTAPASHVHVSGYTLLDDASRPAGLRALAAASAQGVTTSVDAASAAPLRRVTGATFLDWIRGVDILFANLDEARALLDLNNAQSTSDAAVLAQALATYARRVVVKLGPDGAVMASQDGAVLRVPAVAAESVVDPTGAGDAFAAGFLTAWLSGADAQTALQAGARSGAHAVAQLGGRPPAAAT